MSRFDRFIRNVGLAVVVLGVLFAISLIAIPLQWFSDQVGALTDRAFLASPKVLQFLVVAVVMVPASFIGSYIFLWMTSAIIDNILLQCAALVGIALLLGYSTINDAKAETLGVIIVVLSGWGAVAYVVTTTIRINRRSDTERFPPDP